MTYKVRLYRVYKTGVSPAREGFYWYWNEYGWKPRNPATSTTDRPSWAQYDVFRLGTKLNMLIDGVH